MFYVKCTLNVEQSISFKHIFKHIFNIISLSYESLRDQSNYVQQLSRDNRILSTWKIQKYSIVIFHKHKHKHRQT